jgi:hypothetical protein
MQEGTTLGPMQEGPAHTQRHFMQKVASCKGLAEQGDWWLPHRKCNQTGQSPSPEDVAPPKKIDHLLLCSQMPNEQVVRASYLGRGGCRREELTLESRNARQTNPGGKDS